MSEASQLSPVGEPAGTLPPNEQQLLIKQQLKNIKGYRIGFIVCAVTFFLLFTFIGAIALYVLLQKEQRKLATLQAGAIVVYKVQGTLSYKNLSAKNVSMYGLIVGDFMLPAVITAKESPLIKQYFGQTISAEYAPAIAKNRCLYDAQGNGYNFITGAALSP